MSLFGFQELQFKYAIQLCFIIFNIPFDNLKHECDFWKDQLAFEILNFITKGKFASKETLRKIQLSFDSNFIKNAHHFWDTPIAGRVPNFKGQGHLFQKLKLLEWSNHVDFHKSYTAKECLCATWLTHLIIIGTCGNLILLKPSYAK